MTGLYWTAAILLAVASLAIVGQQYRYLRARRDVVADRQDLLHSSSAFHVATVLALVPGQELLSAVRKVSLMTTDQTRAVKFQLKKGKLILFTRAQDVGEATVEIEADYNGELFDIVFNPDYVIDYLKVINDEQVEFHFKDKTSAGLFRIGKNYQYVLMPLTISL